MDFDRKVYAAWIDGQVLGEELWMSSSPPATLLHLAMAGTRDQPAFVDDLAITRLAPEGFERPVPLIPPRGRGLLFRLAGMGNFRLSDDSNYQIKRLYATRSADQIGRAGADLAILLGHYALKPGEERAYRDLATDLGTLTVPWYPVRGPQDPADLFRTHFRKEALSHSVVRSGVRLVFVDPGPSTELDDGEVSWMEAEFKKAREAHEEIVVWSFASPWNKGYGGVGPEATLGPAGDRLKALLGEYKVLLFVSAHYRRGPWHEEEQGTHFIGCGSPVLRKGTPPGWSLLDVYDDRIEVYFKPLFSACPRKEVEEFVSGVPPSWERYDPGATFPHLRAPMVFKRHRPAGASK